MITKDYINQCEKAKEIQEACKYEGGEIFLNVAGEIEIMPFNLIEKMKKWYKYYYHVWLPTQEQLQEIILPVLKKKYNKAWDLNKMARTANWVFRIFNCFLNEHSRIYSNDMTELWLAFVMKKKYNKVWNEKKWTPI